MWNVPRKGKWLPVEKLAVALMAAFTVFFAITTMADKWYFHSGYYLPMLLLTIFWGGLTVALVMLITEHVPLKSERPPM
ncbi:MAG: hypothetical protein V4486_01805 [Patescibacteria group bacterium]